MVSEWINDVFFVVAVATAVVAAAAAVVIIVPSVLQCFSCSSFVFSNLKLFMHLLH